MDQTVKHENKLNWVFWLHLFITLLAWVGPFLFSWYLMIIAYSIVTLQFIFFKRCFMNAGHQLNEEEHNTFYAELLEIVGVQPNRKSIKWFVRNLLYPLLAGVTLLWQLVLGFKPLLF